MSTAVQRYLRRTGLAGYEPATMATLLAAFDRQPPGFQFVDVGANMGLYSAICAVMFVPGRVVAFEPTPDVAAIARRVFAANGIAADVGRVEQCALGDRPGTVPLYLSARSDSSNSLVSGFTQHVGAIDVSVTTLDDYAASTGVAPDVVKVDTETFESVVIDGGRRTLERHRPWLVVEVLHRRGHDHGVELTAAMDGLDYTYYRLSQTTDWRPRPAIAGEPGSRETDWLLTPEPLDAHFAGEVRRWADLVAGCTVDRNPPIPLLTVARHVLRRDGVLGLCRRTISYLRKRISPAEPAT
jgi:FkbM family methyltransferase